MRKRILGFSERDWPDVRKLLEEFRKVGRTLRHPKTVEEARLRSRANNVLLGKPDPTGIEKGASGTFTLWTGDKGAEAATTRSVEAYCRSSSIDTDQMAYIQKVNGGWEAVPAECQE